MVNELHINSYLFSKTTSGHCTCMSNISDSITAFCHKLCSQLISLKSLGKFTCNQSLIYRITPHTTRTFIHHNTNVKEGMRVINGYINRTFFTLMLWVRGVRGSEHLFLVGSYCLLSCHHDDVMMIAIMIPYMYQLMFENRLLVLVIGITCTVTLITINTVSL